MVKRVLSVLLSLSLILTCIISAGAVVDTAPRTITGECGDGLGYTLDENGLLTIFVADEDGEHDYEIDSFAFSRDTFSDYLSIRTLYVADGVSRFDFTGHQFDGCENLTSIYISERVILNAMNAFENCINLTTIAIPSSYVPDIDYEFAGCDAIESIYFLGDTFSDLPVCVISSHASDYVAWRLLCAFFNTGQDPTLANIIATYAAVCVGMISMQDFLDNSPTVTWQIAAAQLDPTPVTADDFIRVIIEDYFDADYSFCQTYISDYNSAYLVGGEQDMYISLSIIINRLGVISSLFDYGLRGGYFPSGATIHYPLGNENWENILEINQTGVTINNGYYNIAMNGAVAYVDGNPVAYKIFDSQNDGFVLPSVPEKANQLLLGWYDTLRGTPINGAALLPPESAFVTVNGQAYVSETPYIAIVQPQYRSFSSVSQDDSDLNENVSDYGEFDLCGVQIRSNEYTNPGLRFVTSFGKDLFEEIDELSVSSVEYGYVIGTYDNIRSENPGLNETTGRITDTTRGVKKIVCSNSEDHKSYTDYSLYSLVITYDSTSSNANESTYLVARPYVTYLDAQNIRHTFYADYTGSSTAYGGCKISYTDACEYIEDNIETGLKR